MRIAGVAQWQCKRFVSERLWVQLLPPAPISKARTGQARRAHARIAQLEEPPACTWRDARSTRCCGLQFAPLDHEVGHRFGKAERQVRDLRGAPFLRRSPTGRRRFPQKEDSAGSNPSRRTNAHVDQRQESPPSKRGQCWFESNHGTKFAGVAESVYALGLNPGLCRFDPCRPHHFMRA